MENLEGGTMRDLGKMEVTQKMKEMKILEGLEMKIMEGLEMEILEFLRKSMIILT